MSSASNASSFENPLPAPAGGVSTVVNVPARLSNWPVQIKLAPVNAPYFQGCDLLVAADCTAFAYGAFHEDFLKGRVCLIGCPKLDGVDYTEKLAQIIAGNNVRSVRVARMQVPCCGGLEQAAQWQSRVLGMVLVLVAPLLVLVEPLLVLAALLTLLVRWRRASPFRST